VSEATDDQGPALHVGYVIGRLDRVLRRNLRDQLRTHDLSVPEYTTLSVLLRRPGLSNAQLARRAFVTPQTMNEIMVQLLQRKLVTRRVDPRHSRVLQTRLTAPGRRLIERCEAETDELERRMLDGLSKPERDRLTESLRTCVRNLDAGL